MQKKCIFNVHFHDGYVSTDIVESKMNQSAHFVKKVQIRLIQPHLLALSYSFDSKLFLDNATVISLLSLIIICSSELNECCFVVLSQILTGSSFWLTNIFSVFASSDRWTRFSRITQGLKSCICSDYYYSCGVLSLCTKLEHSNRLLPPASHCSVITAP